MFRLGLFDHPNNGSIDANVTSDEHNLLARQLSAESTVLLQNHRHVLPLISTAKESPWSRTGAPSNIAVIGIEAGLSPLCCGTGSGAVDPPYVVSTLQGIRSRASGSGIDVSYTPAGETPPLNQFYSSQRDDHFLDPECIECNDQYVDERLEGYALDSCWLDNATCLALNLYWNDPLMDNCVSTSQYAPASSKNYTFVRTIGYILAMNYSGPFETRILEMWSTSDDHFTFATNASRQEATKKGYKLIGQLGRVLVQPQDGIQQAAKAAAAADVAVISVATISGEGHDRANLSLSAHDTAVIETVVAANPNTVVVVHNPGAVLMPWADRVPAILAAFFPGQEGGNALADVLFGDVNPSARLPLTFPARETDTPLATQQQYPGINGTVEYSEKLLVGYRWWDQRDIEPLFAFGHGLSYTTFEYTDLKVGMTGTGPGVNVTATFQVRNVGLVDGSEVPQLYVSFPASCSEPPYQLKAFTKVFIPAETAAKVSFSLAWDAFSVWNVDKHQWSVCAGTFRVTVGASSRDLRLVESIDVS